VHRPGGISALTDQQIAGGIMWVPGSLAYTITMLIGFYRWLEPDRAPRPISTAIPT
jgi:cytochrome c oxidase assembly factor CtaG